MPDPTSSAEVLAHWRYSPEFWQDFVEYESNVYSRSVRSARHFMIATAIVAILLIVPLVSIPLYLGYPLNSNILGPAFGIAVLAVIFLIVGFIMSSFRRQKITKLEAKP